MNRNEWSFSILEWIVFAFSCIVCIYFFSVFYIGEHFNIVYFLELCKYSEKMAKYVNVEAVIYIDCRHNGPTNYDYYTMPSIYFVLFGYFIFEKFSILKWMTIMFGQTKTHTRLANYELRIQAQASVPNWMANETKTRQRLWKERIHENI